METVKEPRNERRTTYPCDICGEEMDGKDGYPIDYLEHDGTHSTISICADCYEERFGVNNNT